MPEMKQEKRPAPVDQTGGGALSKANKGEAKMKKPYF